MATQRQLLASALAGDVALRSAIVREGVVQLASRASAPVRLVTAPSFVPPVVGLTTTAVVAVSPSPVTSRGPPSSSGYASRSFADLERETNTEELLEGESRRLKSANGWRPQTQLAEVPPLPRGGDTAGGGESRICDTSRGAIQTPEPGALAAALCTALDASHEDGPATLAAGYASVSARTGGLFVSPGQSSSVSFQTPGVPQTPRRQDPLNHLTAANLSVATASGSAPAGDAAAGGGIAEASPHTPAVRPAAWVAPSHDHGSAGEASSAADEERTAIVAEEFGAENTFMSVDFDEADEEPEVPADAPLEETADLRSDRSPPPSSSNFPSALRSTASSSAAYIDNAGGSPSHLERGSDEWAYDDVAEESPECVWGDDDSSIGDVGDEDAFQGQDFALAMQAHEEKAVAEVEVAGDARLEQRSFTNPQSLRSPSPRHEGAGNQSAPPAYGNGAGR